ncbi:Anti-sigma regulatory factor (Ser/Thr protein kinase) [Parafrankia irregularis]|uniref:Anti-sigma regulatory factor (Ser/Thr protein kinase) n=1 Tax=Parafrankia irregularis TaxID=795642 RepID=A0A0S4QS29_9ACTN|nr:MULTISPECIES: ATP-binding protein [Parafrankia]MBE3202627.1 ATP-binding protein [Parafrankia sp. CH37]CUU57810.1 Anti-sigma regulatory factor (Ser/Thr protein kinase) [Parafrankia irregularis]
MAEALTAGFDLHADPRAAGRARALVADLLAAWGCSSASDVAKLLVSEVVTNAVRFVGAREVLRLTVECGSGLIRVSVSDGSPLRPVLRAAQDDDESGRGMQLVSALAERWGVVDDPPSIGCGKQVWFELAASDSAAIACHVH